MADAKKCDRCGKFYEEPKINTAIGAYPNGRPITSVDINTYGLSRSIDICPECEKEFRIFMGLDLTCLK